MTRYWALGSLFLVWSIQAQSGGFATLRSPAQDLGQGEAGGAAAQGADRALVNPGGLRLDGQSAWIEAGDQSGLRQQRLGVGSLWSAYSWSLDLGLDSLEGLELRDAQGALVGSFGLQAPWAQAALARDSAWGRWGLAAGGRDRRWLGGSFSPEVAAGWSWSGPLALGLSAAWRDLSLEGQVSVAWQTASGRWGLQGGHIQQGSETRYGLGSHFQLWPGLDLRLGWTRWAQLENQRLSVGLGWQSPSTAMSYAWLPGAAIGSAQKLSVQGRWAVASPTPMPTWTPTPSPSPTATPAYEPSPTPSPTIVPTPVQVELEFVLPK